MNRNANHLVFITIAANFAALASCLPANSQQKKSDSSQSQDTSTYYQSGNGLGNNSYTNTQTNTGYGTGTYTGTGCPPLNSATTGGGCNCPNGGYGTYGTTTDGSYDSSGYNNGTYNNGTYGTGTCNCNAYASGAYPGNTAYPAGAYPNGTYPAGAYPNGTYPTGYAAYPNGVPGTVVNANGTYTIGPNVTGAGLALNSQVPDYNDNIAPMLNAYCATSGCHVPGVQQPDLTNYQAVVAAAQQSLTDISAGRMPTTGPLPAAQASMFSLWVSSGEPQTLQDANNISAGGIANTGYANGVPANGYANGVPANGYVNGGASDGTYNNGAYNNESYTNPASSNCYPNGYPSNTGYANNYPNGTYPNGYVPGNGNVISSGWVNSGTIDPTTGGTVPPADPNAVWSSLLSPPQLATCQASGKLLDRTSNTCTQANVATSYACTDGGIRAEFQKVGLNVDATIGQYESQGFQIDQCGELNGDPVVYLYMKVTDPDGTYRLNMQKICKAGSPACN